MIGELPRRKSNLAVDVTTYRTLEQYDRVEDHLKSMSNETWTTHNIFYQCG